MQVRDDAVGRIEWAVAVDGRDLPLSIVLTPGNVNDATAFSPDRERPSDPAWPALPAWSVSR